MILPIVAYGADVLRKIGEDITPDYPGLSKLIEDMWETGQYQKHIELPNGRFLRALDFNPQKLFNYYVQCLETVNNVKKLLKLKTLMEGKKSKVVLVVYDSILIDFAKEDGREFVTQIKDILQEDNYLVKAQMGKTYDFGQK